MGRLKRGPRAAKDHVFDFTPDRADRRLRSLRQDRHCGHTASLEHADIVIVRI
jgi:hypothetical protein